jgi:CRISPR-associated protein Cmr3
MAIMFKFLVQIMPWGLMYGSTGAFLSPENLVGRSGTKFPPEAAALSGLYFGVNQEQRFIDHQELRDNLHIAGPFWSEIDTPEYFYVPIPKHIIVTDKDCDIWQLQDGQWHRNEDADTEAEEYTWQKINAWGNSPELMKSNQEVTNAPPWRFTPILHPKIQLDERVVAEDGLFLENAVQVSDEHSLVYLATHEIPNGYYRFGGEGHVVEIQCHPLPEDSPIIQQLTQPIDKAFALITPATWGSTRFSHRYPQQDDFPKPIQMLVDRPIPYRYRVGGRLGRGRYSVPAGSVYVFEEPLNKTWWDFPLEWFPKEGMPLKHLGCGLCLQIEVTAINQAQAA